MQFGDISHLLVRMEVASSRPDQLPTLSIAKTSEHSLFVKFGILETIGAKECVHRLYGLKNIISTFPEL